MKGDKASKHLLEALETENPHLYEKLGLSPSDPAQPAVPVPPLTQNASVEMSTTLIPSNAKDIEEKLKEEDVYHVDKKSSSRQRLALLINNVKFDDPKYNRNGAEKDGENMYVLLTALGCEVTRHSDLSGQEMDAAVMKFSKDERLRNADSVFVVIMSHGSTMSNKGIIHGVHIKPPKITAPNDPGEPDAFEVDNIFTYLNTENCPALFNKPKVIIIQACRGAWGERGGTGAVWVSDSIGGDASLNPPEDDGFHHKEKDFIAFLSSTPDEVSYRHPTNGAFLIQYIVEKFNNFAHKDHIVELFRKVTSQFEKQFGQGGKLQIPNINRSSLTKHFYLFPGY